MIDIEINNDIGFDFGLEFNAQTLEEIVRAILIEHGIEQGEVSLAIIDDSTMHRLNVQHLQHDYPTDVLSFVLDDNAQAFEGEVIVSCDTATSMAPEYNWSAQHELLLYFVHGTLHLAGYDDHTPADRQKMREQETLYLQKIGIHTPDDHSQRMLQQSTETNA